MSFRQTFAPILDFVYPPRCPACGNGIAGGSPTGDDAFCAPCWGKLQLPGQPWCATCQHPFGADHFGAEAQCARCLADTPMHDGIAAATIYGDVSREMVLHFKHGGRIALAGPMGRTIAARIGQIGGENPLVTPVPLHRWRLWKRGYNQSAMLAKVVAGTLGLEFRPDLLLRRKATPSLGGLDPGQRRDALKGAIACNPRVELAIRGRNIILVDDVLTSGATSDACVRVLKKAGADRVVIACYARVRHAQDVPKRETPETVGLGRPRD
ncbi:ComF family protein [Croceicoccus sediminis]|uniref:ComF family protein n=1 Tax=Croceicoccus sediminis TaxID=2571150 RepID=UPI0011841BC6|nr:ComF family protein [Croceicoccus sediminis]